MRSHSITSTSRNRTKTTRNRGSVPGVIPPIPHGYARIFGTTYGLDQRRSLVRDARSASTVAACHASIRHSRDLSVVRT
jgi:hypothetical protein